MELDEVAQKQHTQPKTEHKPEHHEVKEEHHKQSKTKTDIKNYVIIALATALFVVGLVWIRDAGIGSQTPSVPGPSPALPPPSAPVPVVDMKALVDDDPILGDKNAPVTIIEFSDYQCPFCGRFFSQTLPQIKEKYINTGKARLVYRDFPLDSIHQEATPAAIAANCAGEQGKYFEFHDKIFENQAALGTENYKKWAAELELDTKKFNECVDTQKYASEVRKDFSDGAAVGVQGTPAFFIDGRLISGAQPYPVFEQAIEQALS